MQPLGRVVLDGLRLLLLRGLLLLLLLHHDALLLLRHLDARRVLRGGAHLYWHRRRRVVARRLKRNRTWGKTNANLKWFNLHHDVGLVARASDDLIFSLFWSFEIVPLFVTRR